MRQVSRPPRLLSPCRILFCLSPSGPHPYFCCMLRRSSPSFISLLSGIHLLASHPSYLLIGASRPASSRPHSIYHPPLAIWPIIRFPNRHLTHTYTGHLSGRACLQGDCRDPSCSNDDNVGQPFHQCAHRQPVQVAAQQPSAIDDLGATNGNFDGAMHGVRFLWFNAPKTGSLTCPR